MALEMKLMPPQMGRARAGWNILQSLGTSLYFAVLCLSSPSKACVVVFTPGCAAVLRARLIVRCAVLVINKSSLCGGG